jgi:trimethylamine:corrinoid methyltransferase-like protein
MAKLGAKQRAEVPTREFGLPEKARSDRAKKETGNYPMPDTGHAISAKRLSRKQRKAGNLTEDEFERVNRKADKVLEEDRGH